MVMNRRHENRFRRKSGRARTNPLRGMTEKGQALWAAEHMENAYNYMSVYELAEKYREHL